MRILMIGDRGSGGIQNYSVTVSHCLKKLAPCFHLGEDEPFAGKSGHDIREFFQIRRIVKRFNPDIVQINRFSLMVLLYLRLFTRVPRVASLHMPYKNPLKLKDKILLWLLRPCYFLPVSKPTWDGFRTHYPDARGEVFFNSLVIGARENRNLEIANRESVIGMVGRNADQKDWPSFHRMAAIVSERMGGRIKIINGGEQSPCDGKAMIRQMDVFVMTSKHEQLPTTLIECLAAGTPICGFLPDGGTQDILEFSSGPLKSMFIKERDCAKLADMVIRLLGDVSLRKAVADDGWQILTRHFNAETNVKRQLVGIYEKIIEGLK